MAEQPPENRRPATPLSLLLGAASAGIVFSTTHYSSYGHVLSWLSLTALSLLVSLGHSFIRCVRGGFSCAIDAKGQVVNARRPLSDIGLTYVGLVGTSRTDELLATAIRSFLLALAEVSQIVIVVVLRRVNHMATTRETIHE